MTRASYAALRAQAPSARWNAMSLDGAPKRPEPDLPLLEAAEKAPRDPLPAMPSKKHPRLNFRRFTAEEIALTKARQNATTSNADRAMRDITKAKLIAERAAGLFPGKGER